MRPTLILSASLLAATVSAAPLAVSNEPRGIAQDAKNIVVELAGAVKVALNRVRYSKILPEAIEHVKLPGALTALTKEEANALIIAAKRGDAKAIAGIQNAIKEYGQSQVAMKVSKGGKALLDMVVIEKSIAGDSFWVISPFKANKVDAKLVAVGEKLSQVGAKWKALGPAKQWAIVTAGLVGGTGVTLGVVLGTHHAGDSSIDLPEHLSEDDMNALEKYIQAHPEKYQELMKDIDAHVTRITEEQKEQLTAMAPDSFVESVSDTAASRRAVRLSELD